MAVKRVFYVESQLESMSHSDRLELFFSYFFEFGVSVHVDVPIQLTGVVSALFLPSLGFICFLI